MTPDQPARSRVLSGPLELTEAQWHEFRRVVGQFDEAWRRGGRPEIASFLPETDPLRSALLRELVHVDFENRCQAGDEPRSSDYFVRFPELVTDDPLMQSLAAVKEQLWRPDASPAEMLSTLTNAQLPEDTETLPPVPEDRQGSSKTFGGYEILKEIAHGGMGVVYKARQTSLNRLVALKMIRAGEFANDAQIRRFYAEAEAAAGLDHPGIVPVYEVGQTNGQHFYSMALVDGISLNDIVAAKGPLPPKDAAGILKKVADAVQFAHERGVIHRDIKPQNILLDEIREPRVTDFGLAKLAQGSSDTVTGQIMGTPSYMPPEQAAGKIDQIRPASDVYSLGATLYFLLTGQLPFQAESPMATVRQVLEVAPIPPRKINPSVPRDLDTTCLKCLRKEAGKRYSSAALLAADLTNWLEHRPITARPVSRREKAWLWCKRQPRVAGLSAAIVVLAVVGSLVALARQDAATSNGLVDALLKADISQVPEAIKRIEGYRRQVAPLLVAEQKRLFDQDKRDFSDENRLLRASLALLPVDSGQRDYLAARLLGADAAEFPVIRDALDQYQHGETLCDRFWGVLRDSHTARARRFRAACALARFAPQDAGWDQVADDVAGNLVQQNVQDVGKWRVALAGVKDRLLTPLTRIYCNARHDAVERSMATDILAEYAADRVDVLAGLMQTATEKQFEVVFPKLSAHRVEAVPQLENLLTVPTASAQTRANAAVALLRLKATKTVWLLLKHSADPQARSDFIHWVSPLGGDPQPLIERLDHEPDVTIRRALLLALGEFPEAQLPSSERQKLTPKLLTLYENDPDPGLHGAAEWLLRQWEKTQEIHAVVEMLRVNDQQLRTGEAVDKRQWYVNSQGQTFVILEAQEFQMGSPKSEPLRNEIEIQHQRRITRTFAIATKEVTNDQYRRFTQTNPDVARSERGDFLSRTGDSPQLDVDWYHAARFCNWLSAAEGIPTNQWCYEPNAEGYFADGMHPADDYLLRRGYRLPTEAEWEYAARAGATTSRYFGGDDALLDRFGWFRANDVSLESPTIFARPCARLKPNDFGLFDMLGNCVEWCHERYTDYATGDKSNVVIDGPDLSAVENRVPRVIRGGSFADTSDVLRSAARKGYPPQELWANFGFRVARTYR
jgi:formylglycine-generating enzyme required for sulfatase activity/tRNA A-37 threonylcarbamoyl transferase component Bud32